ncbi:aromatic amino acid transport family protein [Vibrio sp. NTOU-M3]|uniref:aromatic amino acid transport family protein n=1 Tax=Vibrio sp. NTOU-M3 TaxID=3234954 RepID=UPI00349F289B
MQESRKTRYFSELTNSSHWSKLDTHWMLSLFGTAVGAGILFLPINLGIGGFWPLILMALLAYPMTYLAHRGLARFVLSSKNKNADFTDVVEEHFGSYAGRLITLLYFFSIFPILLIYGVGLTNTVDSFLVNQAKMTPPPRELLSATLVFSLIAIMLGGEKLMLRAFAIMVYPLVAILALLSLYLIPNWQMPDLSIPDGQQFISTVWLAVPVIIFSFSHTPAISSFANKQRREYPNNYQKKSEQILKRTSLMLMAFVLLFVFSCVLALSPEQLQQAKSLNVSVLSYLANVTDNPYIATLGPLVAFIAITSSFLGHFLGARESMNGLLTKYTKLTAIQSDAVTTLFLFLSIWAAAVLNPSILGMIEALSGPVIAMILFIMPMVAAFKVEALRPYRQTAATYFILLTGFVAISALIYNLLS